eukprot:1774291-Amphidinium_carterae.1
MYAGRRRVFLQGAISDPVTATHGMPLVCGHAVDLLHAFLLKTLKSAGRYVFVRKYVDDMVLVASGLCFAGHLCYGYRQVHKSSRRLWSSAMEPICQEAPNEGLEIRPSTTPESHY